MRTFKSIALGIATAAGAMLVLTTVPASAHTSTQVTKLKGKHVSPGPGAPRGAGSAEIKSASEIETVCYKIGFKRIGKVTAAAIYEGLKGETGEVVVDLFDSSSGRKSPTDGCVHDVDAATIEAIQSHPQSYYLQLDTQEHPEGAVRGQLRNKEGSYTPPASCYAFPPSEPQSPSGQTGKALKAKVHQLTDARTERHPFKRKYTFGQSLWVAGQPVTEDTAFYNFQVDTASVTRGFFLRAEWDASSGTDIDLVVYDVFGEKVTSTLPEDILLAAATGGPTITKAPGVAAIEGLDSDRCDGYTVEVRAPFTPGAPVRLSTWLDEVP